MDALQIEEASVPKQSDTQRARLLAEPPIGKPMKFDKVYYLITDVILLTHDLAQVGTPFRADLAFSQMTNKIERREHIT